MNYELAKELKDGGFPQIPQHFFMPERDKKGEIIEDSSITIPTLEELIDACGEEFDYLKQVPFGEFVNAKTGKPCGIRWHAYPTEEGYKGDCMVDCCGYESGKTPTEAVARLWLELNKHE